MITFEDIYNKARDVADIVGEKTGDFVSMTKLKMALADNKREMAATMEGLGRLVYDAKKSDADVTAMMDEAIAHADELEAQRAELEKKLYGYQNAAICPQCGAVNDKDAKFCQQCAQELK